MLYTYKCGETALHYGAYNGHVDIVCLLLLYNAAIKYKYKFIPKYNKNEIIKEFKKHQYIKINRYEVDGVEYDAEGKEAVDKASTNKYFYMNACELIDDKIDMISKLLKNSSNNKLLKEQLRRYIDIKAIISYLCNKQNTNKQNTNEQNTNKFVQITDDTILMNAIKKGYINIVRLLLFYNPNPNIKFEGNVTPLMLAAINGHIDIVNFLLEKGANINDQNEDGLTALMFAVMNKHINIVEFLLDRGAVPTIKNKSGQDISQFVDQYYGKNKSNKQYYSQLQKMLSNHKRNNTASIKHELSGIVDFYTEEPSAPPLPTGVQSNNQLPIATPLPTDVQSNYQLPIATQVSQRNDTQPNAAQSNAAQPNAMQPNDQQIYARVV